jgi:hypothetical protein
MTDDEFKLLIVNLTLERKLYKDGKCAVQSQDPPHSPHFAKKLWCYNREDGVYFVVCTNHVNYVSEWNSAQVKLDSLKDYA